MGRVLRPGPGADLILRARRCEGEIAEGHRRQQGVRLAPRSLREHLVVNPGLPDAAASRDAPAAVVAEGRYSALYKLERCCVPGWATCWLAAGEISGGSGRGRRPANLFSGGA